MAEANFTRPHSGPEILSVRAANELRAASAALRGANALLGVIQHAISTCQTDQLSAYTLTDIGIELTSTSIERAEGEADFFAEQSEVRHA